MQPENSGLMNKLHARASYLEAEYSKVLEALRSAAGRGDFRPVPGSVRDPQHILGDAAEKIMRLAPFDIAGLWLVDESTSDFKMGCCLPDNKQQFMDSEFEHLISEGIISLALAGEQPVFASGSIRGDRYVVQSLATASRVRGLFAGRLRSGESIPDVALPLLMILAQGCAASLENLELYRLLREKHNMLVESEDRYANVMAAINDGIWDWDLEKDSVFFDERYYTMAGYSPGDFPHHIDEWEKRVHPDDQDYCRQCLEKHFSGKNSKLDVEFRFLRKDGKWMWIRGRGKVVRWDKTGRPVRMVGTHTDISDRRMAEESSEKLQAQLNQAQKMESVGILAGGMAHDFNNLLQVMAGNIQLILKNKPFGHDDVRRLRAVSKSIDRAGKLVRQLLLFSRKAETRMQELNLNNAVKDTVELLERTLPRMISIKMRLDSNIRKISADSLQIEQMLLNLCSNAADAMPQGGRLIFETQNITLDKDFVQVHAGSRPGEHVLLTVSDTGCGMDREVVEHIFDPFFTTKEVGKVTGLGLASVYGIVKGHNGYILCYSEPGHGTTFKIYFPVTSKESRGSVVVPGKKASSLTGTETILVVDDEDDIRELTAEILQSNGYNVLTASSGEEALAVFSRTDRPIDLFILDLNMPGMGGRRCLEELLHLDNKARVLIASGYSTCVQVSEYIRSGTALFIGKPYQINELLTKVRESIDRDTAE
ncbi:MAG: PAS domain-containing protein [Desulfonatronovibrio sp.]